MTYNGLGREIYGDIQLTSFKNGLLGWNVCNVDEGFHEILKPLLKMGSPATNNEIAICVIMKSPYVSRHRPMCLSKDKLWVPVSDV